MQNGYCLFLNTNNVRKGEFDFAKLNFISKDKDELLSKGKLGRHDVILTTRGTVGNTAYYDDNVMFENMRINSGMVILRSKKNKLLPIFLLKTLNSDLFSSQVGQYLSGSAQPQLPIRVLSQIPIPLPPLETQKQIVAEIEKEQKMVEECKKLIAIHEQKIKDKIAEIWREEGRGMSKTVIVCGAGVDKSPGLEFPLATELVPQIRQYLETDEGGFCGVAKLCYVKELKNNKKFFTPEISV